MSTAFRGVPAIVFGYGEPAGFTLRHGFHTVVYRCYPRCLDNHIE